MPADVTTSKTLSWKKFVVLAEKLDKVFLPRQAVEIVTTELKRF